MSIVLYSYYFKPSNSSSFICELWLFKFFPISVMGCYELIFRFWTFSQLMICEMSIFKSKRLWPEWSQRKIRSKTHFLIFWSWNILSLSTLAAFISWLSGQNWYRLGFCWSSDVKLSSRWYFRSILHSVESEPNGWTELVSRI